MGVFSENAIIGASAAGGYDIDQSARFEDGGPAYMERTPSGAGNRKTWTWSSWVKRANAGSHQNIFCFGAANTDQVTLAFNSNNQLSYSVIVSNTTTVEYVTEQQFRDPISWYHIVVTGDTTPGSPLFKVYINGVQATSFATSTNSAAQNLDTAANNTVAHRIGERAFSSSQPFDGYLAEVHWIDGTALDASSFGETNEDTNQWGPIKYSGSYGTNGFYLDFSNSSSLGADASGSNNFTTSGMDSYDQVKDSPTNNFATLNPLQSNAGGYANTFSEGNLKNNVTTGGQSYPSTFYAPPLDQKWYWECYIVSGNAAKGPAVHLNMDWTSGYENQKAHTWKWEGSNGITYNVLNSGSYTVANSTLTTNGDIFAIFIDGADIKFYKNGSLTYTATGVITTANSNVMIPSSTCSDGTVYVMNFGQDSSFAGNKTSGSANATDANGFGDFYYTPPAGALACCSQNISEPSIVDPTDHFDVTLYSGNGSTQSISSLNFQPDLVWTKRRNIGNASHGWTDSVRGSGKSLKSNDDSGEVPGGTPGATDDMYAFTTNGYSVGADNYLNINTSGSNYVGWTWKGGGSAVSNTDGAITTQVSANPTAGFSVVTYTGTGNAQTIGHGLSQAPELCIFKKRNANGADGLRAWAAWHQYCTTGGTFKKGLVWSSTNAEFDAYLANVPPTASTFTLYANYQEQNFNGDDYVAYFWHSVEGYSKVGMYVGNSNTDGPFVHTGFKPAFIVLKNRDAGGGGNSWVINDNKRMGYNTDNKRLRVNSQGQEDDTGRLSIFSNGFKLTQTYDEANQSGNTFVYIAIAETAYKYANPY